MKKEDRRLVWVRPETHTLLKITAAIDKTTIYELIAKLLIDYTETNKDKD